MDPHRGERQVINEVNEETECRRADIGGLVGGTVRRKLVKVRERRNCVGKGIWEELRDLPPSPWTLSACISLAQQF